jgi:type IV secretory pathway VirB10-like protein
VVVNTPHHPRVYRPVTPRPRESIVALTVIAAAALATFLALFITSRPYDPMNSTLPPQQVVPSGPPVPSPSAKQSPTPAAMQAQAATPARSPEVAAESPKAPVIDDATIQAQIEKVIAAEPALAKLDVSTIVEGGKVTIVGSVRSADLKRRVEKVVRSVKGVVAVDNQLVITEVTP